MPLIAGRPLNLPKSCVFCCPQASKGGQGGANSTGVRISMTWPGDNRKHNFLAVLRVSLRSGAKVVPKNLRFPYPQKIWNTLIPTNLNICKQIISGSSTGSWGPRRYIYIWFFTSISLCCTGPKLGQMRCKQKTG